MLLACSGGGGDDRDSLVGVAIIAAHTHSDVTFTGNAPEDFADSAHVLVVLDRNATTGDDTESPDVALPAELLDALPDTVSGWDVRSVYMQYDPATDKLAVGVDCFGLCGDADGNGDASAGGCVKRFYIFSSKKFILIVFVFGLD